jgi:hypothetical protein
MRGCIPVPSSKQGLKSHSGRCLNGLIDDVARLLRAGLTKIDPESSSFRAFGGKQTKLSLSRARFSFYADPRIACELT